MSATPNGRLDEPAVEKEAVLKAFRRATREAALRHARLGQPVAITRDGKVVWLQPAEVLAMFANESESGRHDQTKS